MKNILDKCILVFVIIVGLLLCFNIFIQYETREMYKHLEESVGITIEPNFLITGIYVQDLEYTIINNNKYVGWLKALLGMNETELHEYGHRKVDDDYYHFCVEGQENRFNYYMGIEAKK